MMESRTYLVKSGVRGLDEYFGFFGLQDSRQLQFRIYMAQPLEGEPSTVENPAPTLTLKLCSQPPNISNSSVLVLHPKGK